MPRDIIPIVPVERPASGTSSVGQSGLRAMPPLTLYVHVPWCVRKCPYCDFNSHEQPNVLPERDYLDALLADLDQALPLIWGRQVHAIFIGGGTPSLLSAKAVDEMMSSIRARLAIWPDAEVTLEANPGTAEASRFQSYAASGINRLSLGVQSFGDVQLKALGRIHDSAQARRAIELAQAAVKRVNIDMMYGLPAQSPAQFERDLTTAISFGTEHLSLYQLTLEPQTVFAKYPPTLPGETDLEAMESMIDQIALGQGWQRYEVSAYAKPGAQCRHNLNYWRFGDYLGIGPGAHSKISSPERILRQARTRNPSQWMQSARRSDGSHISETRELSSSDLVFEFFLNGLRLVEGVGVNLFESHTGLPLSQARVALDRAVAKGLLTQSDGQIKATDLGWRHLNDLQANFL